MYLESPDTCIQLDNRNWESGVGFLMKFLLLEHQELASQYQQFQGERTAE
jgi:hypothetical protein